MKKVIYLMPVLIILYSCGERHFKCNYLDTNHARNKISYYSEIRSLNNDTVKVECFFQLDSNYFIDKQEPDYCRIEPFNNNVYFLYGIIELRLNAKIGAKWKTMYEENYYDSLDVTIINISYDTLINDIKVNTCVLYEIKYNDITRREDYMNYKLYFDVQRKLPIRKEYYI